MSTPSVFDGEMSQHAINLLPYFDRILGAAYIVPGHLISAWWSLLLWKINCVTRLFASNNCCGVLLQGGLLYHDIIHNTAMTAARHKSDI